jgi:hypothetical protein
MKDMDNILRRLDDVLAKSIDSTIAKTENLIRLMEKKMEDYDGPDREFKQDQIDQLKKEMEELKNELLDD